MPKHIQLKGGIVVEKKLQTILLRFLRKCLTCRHGDLESLVVLTASDICYLLRREEHGIGD